MMMKKMALFLLVMLLLTACSGPQVNGSSGETLQEPENVEIIPQSEFTIAPDTPVLEQSSGELTARIFSAPDATINYVPYLVQGQANRDVVITINDLILLSSPESMFSVPVDLEEGPNLIDIVISDLDGNEVGFSLTITYEP